MDRFQKIVEQTQKFLAHNYNPLPVVLERGKGIFVWDVNGKKYFEMLSMYSALNFGHKHPRLLAALYRQAQKLSSAPRCVSHDRLGEFGETLAEFAGMDKVLPMNTGSEAVETAIKISRKWGYRIKGVEPDKAEIIVCKNNFHGRTIAIISFSTEEQYKDGFGPLTPGFEIIPFSNTVALESMVNENTVAFLVEPIQGEGGINVPFSGYLKEIKSICRKNNILLVLDEIQTGLGRTGYDFAYMHEGIKAAKPDVLILAKALGAGLIPVSAVIAQDEVMDVIEPGDHGSTHGGYPLACAIAIEAINILKEEKLSQNAKEIGRYFISQLSEIKSRHIKEVRGRGLLIGMELVSKSGGARRFCEALLEEGIVCGEAHKNVIRFAPPLIISKDEIDQAACRIKRVMENI